MIGIIAFILGYVLLGFTCYITMADVQVWTVAHYHLWIIVFFDYTILFATLLFSRLLSSTVESQFGKWIFDWPARILLAAILAISASLGFYIENFNICYLVDGLGVFIYLLALVCSTRTTAHIQHVQVKEAQNRVLIDEVRKASLALNIVAQSMPDEFSTQKKQIESIKEELRYLSPSSSQDAHRIEESILKQLQDLKNDCLGNPGILTQRIALLNACIAERKIIN